jgi:cytochrome c biogenesis protein CcmG/thiol:disulfide interchange protein DsbE
MIRSVPARAAGFVLVTALLALVAAGCSDRRLQTPEERALFDFTMKDANGQEFKFADLKGKPLVVNFWATWCGPCKIETPMLIELSKKYKDRGLTILGIETDSEQAAVKKFGEAYEIPYPLLVGIDRADVNSAFDWTGVLPTSVFIRADGTIAKRIIGLQSEEYWDALIRSLF